MEERKDFYDGQQLLGILCPDGSKIRVGKDECESITVIMESGQMAGVPWAMVVRSGNRVYKYNLALAEGVRIR
jgi:hypothetical protein